MLVLVEDPDYENILLIALIISALVILFLLVYLAFLKSQLKKIKSEVSDFRSIQYSKEIVAEWLKILVKEPDPLSELTRYEKLVVNGEVNTSKGPEVINFFFEKLFDRGKVSEIGPFGALVEYKPEIHRSSHDLRPGEKVKVVKPGWRLGSIIIKYPVVHRE